MKLFILAISSVIILGSCTKKNGTPIDQDTLGYHSCHFYYDCGLGRYCSTEGYCLAECRTSADCLTYSQQEICNKFGECLLPDGDSPCVNHQDCGPGRFCNGTCSGNKANCGNEQDCLNPDESCLGTCGAHCGDDNDCVGYSKQLTCTPIGQCLQEGWEQSIDPGILPDVACQQDSQCKALGWSYFCDCEKTLDQKTGEHLCVDDGVTICKPEESPDFDCGPIDNPSHDFCGIWGMRVVVATKTIGVPLINTQSTYSSNLFLVKLSNPQNDTLKMETKICDVQLINFSEDDGPVDNFIWMIIPHSQFRFLPILEQEAQIPSYAKGSTFTTTQMVEVRGALLADPQNDPLPNRVDFENNPNDHRFWDQDRDGKVGVTIWVDGVIRGQVYNVIRWKASYQGTILDPDYIRGTATTVNEQYLISASSDSLIYDTTTILHEDPTRTYFRMQRMNQTTSCAELIREAGHNDAWLRHTNHLLDVLDP